MDSDVDDSDNMDTSDFEAVESENDDLLNFSDETPYQHSTSEPKSKYPFYGKPLIADRSGAEGPVFRLLRIKPARSEAAEIYCDLVSRPVYEAGLRYSALSYSWGRDLKLDTIYIGTRSPEFRITRHLLRALRRLRRATTLVYVWVDAICINQMDLVEKAAQIPLMAQIFNQAREVVIWLGDRVDYAPLSLVGLAYEPTNWPKRLWVVQETLYAASEPVVLLESCRVPMSELLESWHPVHDSAFVDVVARRRRVGNLDEVQVAVRLARECFDHVRQLYDAWLEQAAVGIVRKPLIDWIRLRARRQCTEPLDKIYALLNIISEKESRYFQPNYHKAPKDLFDEVIHYYLFHTSWKLPALQQLVDDLNLKPVSGSVADLYTVRQPGYISYESIVCPEDPMQACGHVSWHFTSLAQLPTLVLSRATSDKVLHTISSDEHNYLPHDVEPFDLEGFDKAANQALGSYFEHFRLAIASLQDVVSLHHTPLPSPGTIIVTASYIFGIQLPFINSDIREGDDLYFTASDGLGRVTRNGQLVAVCFVPRTDMLETFAAHNEPSKFSVEISLPKHARLTTDPRSVVL